MAMVIGADQSLFTLPADLVDRYRNQPVEWGFSALSWATYKRSYSRDGEDWWQTCRRVIEGMFTIERLHCRRNDVSWNEREAQNCACEAYRCLWGFKWAPPGRGLWIIGTEFLCGAALL